MPPSRATLAAFLAFATVFGRSASSTSRPGRPLSPTFRGGAEAAAVALPWSTGVGGDKATAASSGSSIGGKSGKKKRRKRTASSSSASGSPPPSRARKDEGPAVSADIASSVGSPPVDGEFDPADAVAAAAADSDIVDDALLVSPSKKNAKLRPSSLSAGGPGKMPSLFTTPEESMYDRYSACLAATEGLRKARDASLAKGKKRRGNGSAVASDHRGGLLGLLRRQGENFRSVVTKGKDDEEYKRACAQYVLQSSRVIRALGLSVSQFNQLGREVGNDPVLKERVMEQAYLYRMAATLKMPKMPLIEDPSSEQLLKAHRRRRVQMFARSMTEIEELRSEQTERLKRSLNVDRLPDGLNICDPSIQPLLSPKVRAVIEAFPLQAEIIVKKYGLNSDEFNQMLEETRCNPIFRWRVKKYMGKSGDKSAE